MGTRDFTSYYHVCTDGNALEWMFKDDIDFIAGINRIAICVHGSFVEVIAYVLMDNHVHFILHGDIVHCKNFITKYKLLTGKWIRKRHGIREHLKHLPTQLVLISCEEQLLDTIAYIDRNPIIAGYKFLPSEYPWGSAKYMFRTIIQDTGDARELSTFNHSELHRMLKTWNNLPKEWKINEHGMVLPENFLNISKLESLFKSPVKYIYHLSKKLEGKIELQQGALTFTGDKELRIITNNMTQELFGGMSIDRLDFNSKLILARKLRYNYASTPKQISRMLKIDVDILTKFI